MGNKSIEPPINVCFQCIESYAVTKAYGIIEREEIGIHFFVKCSSIIL